VPRVTGARDPGWEVAPGKGTSGRTPRPFSAATAFTTRGGIIILSRGLIADGKFHGVPSAGVAGVAAALSAVQNLSRFTFSHRNFNFHLRRARRRVCVSVCVCEYLGVNMQY